MSYRPQAGEDPARDLNTTPTRPGHCQISIQGPPESVVSVVLLEQSCQPAWDLKVLVVDDGAKRSKSWDGCRLWKAPGFDFLTSSRKVAVNMSVRDLTLHLRVRLHVMAVRKPKKGGLFYRFLSPFQGFVQSEGWDPSEEKSYGKDISGKILIDIPRSYVAMVSVVQLEKQTWGWDRRCQESWAAVYKAISDTYVLKVWEGCEHRPPPSPVLVEDAQALHVSFWSWIKTRFRLMFSFHEPQFQPKKINDTVWNCSVPHWPHFKTHMLCNLKTECLHEQDERDCLYQPCEPRSGLSLEGTCYFTLPRPSQGLTWHYAHRACRRAGGDGMAIFASPQRWYQVTDFVLPKLKWDRYLFVGLSTSALSRPHMYRYIPEWRDGTVAFFSRHINIKLPPACAFFKARQMEQYRKTGIYYVDIDYCKSITTYGHASVLCQHRNAPHDKEENVVPRKQVVIVLKPASLVLNKTYVQCPKGHTTLAFLAYDDQTACLTNEVCRDLEVKGEAEVVRACREKAMLFGCENGVETVQYTLVCDHRQDCQDNSDEQFCVFPLCGPLDFFCVNTQCIPGKKRCDLVVHCLDGSDEVDCDNGAHLRKLHEEVHRPQYPVAIHLDGNGDYTFTPITHNIGDPLLCPETHFQCPGGEYCLPVYLKCNGITDCPGHEDEDGCDRYRCEGYYRCRGIQAVCLHDDYLCDGWPQCPQHDDETYCHLLCPHVCTCYGLAFQCPQVFSTHQYTSLRYLDASDSGLKPDKLETNMMLIYLSLARCVITHLHNLTLSNLRSLDLSDNKISVISVMVFSNVPNLRVLSLAGNPVSDLSAPTSVVGLSMPWLSSLDLSRISLTTLNVERSFLFSSLETLNLSDSGLVELQGKGFSTMSSLSVLDVRGCPMTDFPRTLFTSLTQLQYVYSDKYNLCCPVTLPAGFIIHNCHAPFDEVSSCDALLRSDIYRVSLSILAALAMTGNFGCFCARVFSLKGGSKTGYSMFVVHLSVSDFLMGVYLVVIGVADRLFRGSYLWEDVYWRHSPACHLAGFLSLLSSEVSAFIICLITLDRLLVIRFPFSHVHFTQQSAILTCFLLWTGGLVLAGVPLLPATASWEFYSQTGICIPLPITQSDFPGHDYAFGILILVNFVVFLMIAVGQTSLYVTIARNSMSRPDTSRKSQDLIIARRLLVIVLSDFCCWFPIGLLGLLASQGMVVASEVNVAMAIFVLPLNSALNPFLYTMNKIQEERQRAREQKMLQAILKANSKESS